MQTTQQATTQDAKKCIKRIRSRLERWELTHLRELAASLHQQLEAAEQRASMAKYQADMYQDMFTGLQDELQRDEKHLASLWMAASLRCHLARSAMTLATWSRWQHEVLDALMHDAHECITNDLASPFKAALGEVWAAFEWKHQRHLLEQYELLDVYTEHKAAIKGWDLLALAAERQHVVAYTPETNRPWPVLDTEGAEVFAPPIDLNSTWRLRNTWDTWADLFQLRADQLMHLVQFGQTEELAA